MLRKSMMIVMLSMIPVMVSSVSAQETAQSQPEAVSMDASGLVSLDFREADIRNVLDLLAFKSGVNIVSSPEVTGIVSIRLDNVPWKEALEVILQTYGYAYEQKGSIIMVTTVENLKKRREDALLLAEQEPLITETFTLNFGKASDIIASIEKIKSDRGSVNFDERTNTLIVTDSKTKLELIAKVVDKLDTTTPQVLIEAKVVETTLTNTENMGIDWVTVASVSGAARPTTYPFTEISGNKYIKNANFPHVNDETATDDLFTYGTLNFSQAQAIFELLKTRSNTNILSNPKIVTLDNQPAQVVVGSQYPIPTYTYNEEQARLQVSGWEYMDIGIIFDVTPHVNSAGFVTMDIEPKITAILDFVTVENTSLPRLSNESTKTSVIVKGGETLVIAGLIKDQTTETKKRTPFFGDIPLLGYVFQKSETLVQKTDLLIFLTPHIVTPEIPTDS